MPVVFDQETTLPRQRVMVYGDPKTGKTPLVNQLPLGSEYLGEAVYWAADDGSETLRSCPAELRKYMHVVKGARDPKTGKYDAKREAWEIIMHDWRKEWPGVRTMIVDTLTEVGTEVLADVADSGAFSDKHIKIGDPGSPYQHNIPMQGDYGAAQGEIERMLKAMFKNDLHLFVICHAAVDETQNGTVIAGGPATVGKATIRKIAKPFDAVLRTEKKQSFNTTTKQPEQVIAIHTEAIGVWIGGVRNNRESSPLTEVQVPMGKKLGAFWPLFFKGFYPELSEDMLAVKESINAA